jgi:predicted amidohydrolase
MVLLALMQANAAVLDLAANCAAMDQAAGKAAAAGAGVLLTPELFPVGYAPERIRAEFDPAGLASLHLTLAGIAARHRIALVYSLPAITAAGDWQITATLVDARGIELLSYAKVQLFGREERQAFAPADAAPAVADLHGIPVSLVICYDVEFPETVRAAAVHGARLVLVPTALSEGFEAVPQLLVRARALENQVTVAYANHSGVEAGCNFLGGSVIAGPDGGLLAGAGTGPELLFAELPDPAPGADGRATDGRESAVDYLADRRPETYRSWGT